MNAHSSVRGPISDKEASQTVGGRAWLVLAMLWFVYVLNFLDRQLMSILAKPIQDSLHVTDGQLGLIGGLYFAFFYCFIAIPVGWLADRSNRVAVLSVACGIWSAATMACGMAGSYAQFAVARMTVGFGEAGGVPPSYAIISDYFPPGRRGTALGLYNLGPPVGAALGIAFGAAIAAAFNWRYAFVILGVVGLVAAAGRVADHAGLTPWRLIELREDDRVRLGAAFTEVLGHDGSADKPLRAITRATCRFSGQSTTTMRCRPRRWRWGRTAKRRACWPPAAA